ncbi:hypothetical protein DJ535_13890 [Citrobacter murliniae]|uniref:Secreted protein n=1 Tax=Citrobacter murliniae TaxID=67829 RepID=A0ABY2PTH4_9ENTR|nr:hypothetical protein DJ535_13890 [Citrobacter murliniae]
MFCWSFITYIPVILQTADALTTLRNPSHIVIYAPGDFLPCRVTRPTASPLWDLRKRCSKYLLHFVLQLKLFRIYRSFNSINAFYSHSHF